ncbi:MAG: hypoxanthine phosphoribosyltransferase [Saprospiraceae bacterium]|nr:hypoxanthine phosphoribosyltransferase [Saprospiraceae bacterium]
MMYFSEKKDVVTIGALDFVLYLSAREIQNKIREVAKQIENDYANENPLFLIVLNGAFMFAADLIRNLDIACDVDFVKVSSYKGLASTGRLDVKIANEKELKGRHVIILEDIVDSGFTLDQYLPMVQAQDPASLKVCTLLEKPEAKKFETQVDYTCFKIPTKFVIGYGLDFDEAGRNLPHIYQLIDEYR